MVKLSSLCAAILSYAMLLGACAVGNDKYVRMTDAGAVQGVSSGEGAAAWLGVPFAEPPVEALRWMAPRPAQKWDDIRFAGEPGSDCSQPSAFSHDDKDQEKTGDEDCLYLNVWAPADVDLSGATKLPVMVWIHGGGYVYGSGSKIDGSKLAASQNVIVVSMNYRLGLMGWFTHPSLRAGAPTLQDASGNFALLDQIKALEWVQTNIRNFGGDTDNVTVFGLSAGAYAVLALMASSEADDLFNKAIAISGGSVSTTFSEAENYFDDAEPGLPKSSSEVLLYLLIADGQAVTRAGAKSIVETMDDQAIADYLRSKSFEDYLNALHSIDKSPLSSQLPPWHFKRLSFQILDGTVLPKDDVLSGIERRTKRNHIPVILGATRDEERVLLTYDERLATRQNGQVTLNDRNLYYLTDKYLNLFSRLRLTYDPARSLLKNAEAPVYIYRYDWDNMPALPGDEEIPSGAPHGADWGPIFAGPAMYHEQMTSDARQEIETISQTLMSYFGAFAETGAPGSGRGGQLPHWTRWMENDDDTLLIDSPDDGGVRMEYATVTRDAIFEILDDDDAFDSTQERCEFLASLLEYFYLGPKYTESDFAAYCDGLCLRREQEFDREP